MVDYNYIHGFLNNYGIQISQIQKGSDEWLKTTTNFAKELYLTLYNEEQYMLGQFKPAATSTYTLKWGNKNDLM